MAAAGDVVVVVVGDGILDEVGEEPTGDGDGVSFPVGNV